MKPVGLYIVLAVLCSTLSMAQPDSLLTHADSSATDSLLTHADSSATDSLQATSLNSGPDSLAASMPWYGSVAYRAADTTQTISKQDRRYVQYHTLGELLIRGTAFQPLSQGGYGQFDAISIAGGLQTDLKLSLNGRSLRTAWNDAMNMSTIAPEGIERIEILTGSAAIGLAPALTQTAANLQEVRFNTRTPYTAFWYSQGGGEAVAADVGMAQNVAPGLNVNVGVRRNGADGRYLRTRYDVWNVRAGLRYAADSMTTLGFNYELTSHNTDLWGGIRTNVNLDQLTERTTPTVYDDVRDHQRRHDFTLGYEHLLTPDSAHAINATAYYVLDGMLRIRDTAVTDYTDDPYRFIQYHSQMAGVLVRSRHRMGGTFLRFAAGAEYVQSDSAAYVEQINEVQPRAMVHLDQQVGTLMSIQAAGHLARILDKFVYGIGGGLTWQTTTTRARVDFSYLLRPPTAAEGRDVDPEKVFLGLVEAGHTAKDFNVSGQLFLRSTANPILGIPLGDSSQRVYNVFSVNGGMNQLIGVVLTSQYHHPWFEAKATVRANQQTSGYASLPPFSGDVSANIVYRIGSNSVRGGAKFSLIAPGTLLQFAPLTWQSIEAVAPAQSWANNGLDVFLTAIVGNASVRLSYENVLAQRWYTTAVAPMIIRDLRFSVTWSFFD